MKIRKNHLKAMHMAVICFIFLATPFSQLMAQAAISNIQVNQFNRYDITGRLVFSNSSLGDISFSVRRDRKEVYYVNFFAKNKNGDKDVWVVENYPVMPTMNERFVLYCIAISIDFKLMNIEPGEKVTQLQYAYSVTRQPVRLKKSAADAISARQFSSLNGVPLTASAKVLVSSKRYQNEASSLHNEKQALAVFARETPATATDTIRHEGVPNVEEGYGQCLPGSFARSIAWLIDKNHLNCGMSAQEIYDSLRTLFAGCTTGDIYACMVQKKADFLSSIANGDATTERVEPPANMCGWLQDKMQDCDVELDFATPGGAYPGHIITVTAFIPGADGCCTIEYRDDSQQNSTGGDDCIKVAQICGTSINYNGNNYNTRYLVSECTGQGDRLAKEEGKTAGDFLLLPNKPNPFSSKTTIGVIVKNAQRYATAFVVIRNESGRVLNRLSFVPVEGLNQLQYQPAPDVKGVVYCSVEVNGQITGTRKMMVLQQQE
jgi:hypothetical protein